MQENYVWGSQLKKDTNLWDQAQRSLQRSSKGWSYCTEGVGAFWPGEEKAQKRP